MRDDRAIYCADTLLDNWLMHDLWFFIGALAVAYLIPGPDMVLILQTSANHGRSKALAVAVGLGLARASHVFLAAIGLATLLSTAPIVFDAVRYTGAAYLIWVGIVVARARTLLSVNAATLPQDKKCSWLSSLRTGLLTNLLNPKSLLFCSVLLPQFVRPEQPGPQQFLVLGAILVVTGFFFDLIYTAAGAVLARRLAHSALAQRLQRWIFGTLLIGFGLRLFFA